MQSLAYIPASDGTANASQATVQTIRSTGATTIAVNTVSGFPAKFYGTMGTPHTFTDPVTGETITIISDATAVDFAGHLNAGAIVIDAIAPGYTDAGSKVGDIVVVKPVTEWANNLFNVLSQSLADNGQLLPAAPIFGGGTLTDGWIPAAPSVAWAYSSYDAPTRTGVITVPSDATTKYQAGTRIKITNNSAVQYGIITKVTATTLTVFFAVGSSLTNSAITLPFFSIAKNPFGMPSDPTAWTLSVTNTGQSIKSTPTQNTWYGDTALATTSGAKLALPIGIWRTDYATILEAAKNASTQSDAYVSLSTSATSESDNTWTCATFWNSASTNLDPAITCVKSGTLVITSPATYYLIIMTDIAGMGQIAMDGNIKPTTIKAVCAYL